MSTKQESKTTVSHLPEHGPIDENGREILLQVKNVDITFGKGDDAVKAVKNASFDIYKGETFSLVGESGSGKTTIGRAVIRVNPCSAGEILYKGVKISGKIPHSLDREVIRNIQMVFQDPAASLNERATVDYIVSEGLYNFHLYENEADRVKKVENMINEVGLLPEHLTRYPHEFSGGQRQRVALGRAIVKNQKLFLMDEPLSNLDAKLRVSMRSEISKLHRQLGSTTIYVTHDQVEAMTMADRIVIMKDGVIQQVGKPMDLYEHPANKFVAGFIGSPQMNFYAVKVTGTTMTFSDGNKMHLPESVVSKLNGRQGAFILGIRGEDIKLDPQNLDLYKNNIMSAIVDSVEVMGNENNLYFNFGGTGSVARVSKYEISKPGDTIDFTFVPSRMHFFDTQTEESLF